MTISLVTIIVLDLSDNCYCAQVGLAAVGVKRDRPPAMTRGDESHKIKSLGVARVRAPRDPTEEEIWAVKPAGVEGRCDEVRAALTINVNNSLYSGRLTPHDAPHALTGLVQGVMATGRPPRGVCEIRGKHPHMWALAAVAMGFSVRQMRWEDQSFGNLLTAYGI